LLGSVFFIIGRDALPAEINEFQVVVFGVLFMVVVLLIPGGLTEAGQRLYARASRRKPPNADEPKATKGKELV
jgi:ABC-type branched-subunit amino acid transport system permease subunit